jgi:hypothetical protein
MSGLVCSLPTAIGVGVENPCRWRSSPDALGFFSATTSAGFDEGFEAGQQMVNSGTRLRRLEIQSKVTEFIMILRQRVHRISYVCA